MFQSIRGASVNQSPQCVLEREKYSLFKVQHLVDKLMFEILTPFFIGELCMEDLFFVFQYAVSSQMKMLLNDDGSIK